MPGRVLTNFRFELETGNLATSQGSFNRVEAGKAPPNLIQLHEAGKIFVAETAVLRRPIEESGIVPLHDILSVHEYGEVESEAYERLDTNSWDIAAYIAYGRWLDRVIRAPKQQLSPISQAVLRQAYYLGIGPNEARIPRAKRFGSMPNFYKAIGVVQERKRNVFSEWTDDQLGDYAERVLLELLEENGGETGYVDLNAEIDRRAKEGPFPSCEIFRRDGAYPMKYLVQKGYVDVLSMQPDDYVQWGVNFRLANDGRLPTEQAIKILSKTRRAPSYSKFLEMFRWGEYLERLNETYEARQRMDITKETIKVRLEVRKGNLPDFILEGAPGEVRARRAKWLLVNELFPDLAEAHKRVITRFVAVDELKEVLLDTGKECMHAEDINFAATHAGVAEDLWPEEPKPPYPYLRVPEELLKRQVTTSEVV